MDCIELKAHLQGGEGLTTEFKRCGNMPSRDVFETICSFANRQGGNIFLGVSDSAEIVGVPRASVTGIQRNVVNVISDPNLFNVTPTLSVPT